MNLEIEIESLFKNEFDKVTNSNYVNVANDVNDTINNFESEMLNKLNDSKDILFTENRIREIRLSILNKLRSICLEKSNSIPFTQPEDFARYDIEELLKSNVFDIIEKRGIKSQIEKNKIIEQECKKYQILLQKKNKIDKAHIKYYCSHIDIYKHELIKITNQNKK